MGFGTSKYIGPSAFINKETDSTPPLRLYDLIKSITNTPE